MKEILQVVWMVRQLGGAGSQIWLGPMPEDGEREGLNKETMASTSTIPRERAALTFAPTSPHSEVSQITSSLSAPGAL